MSKDQRSVSRRKVKIPSTKKPESGRTVHITYGNNKARREYPEWLNYFYITTDESLKEIIRRVSVVKTSLISAMLAPTGYQLSGNDIVTYLNILIQQPLIVLLYQKIGDVFSYQPHFDLEKTKASRGSLELRARKSAAGDSFKAEEVPKDAGSSLFNIMNTSFYFRVFLLDTTKDDQPFYEVTKHPEVARGSTTGSIYEYTRLCLNGLLQFHEIDKQYYSKPFIDRITQELSKVLTNYTYDNTLKNRRQYTLVSSSDIGAVEKLIETRQKNALGHEHQIDRIYKRASNAAELLKLLGDSANIEYDKKSFPNIFFTLRAYSREVPRAERLLDSGNTFPGYAHNIYFSVPHSQREHIKEYLTWLGNIGCDGYLSYKGMKNELYGGRKNEPSYGWSFGDDGEFAGYQTFANSLDKLFWRLLAHKKIELLIKILETPVGNDSTSMVDAAFYYGASLYRMPFRRLGGLGRLHALKEVYSRLDENDRANFKYSDIPSDRAFTPLKIDCLRVVVFFYLTRMFGPSLLTQEKNYTKIHLYPIDIGGSIVGTIGKVSYEEKVKAQSPLNALPTNNQTWNQEIIFFTEIVTTIRRTLRQQYRDFQVEAISDAYASSLSTLMLNAHIGNGTSPELMSKFVTDLNKESREIARICPYQEYCFDLVNRPTLDGGAIGVIPIGGQLKLVVEKCKEAPIFRSLQSHSDGNIFTENLKSLTTSLHEKTQIVLDRNKTLNEFSSELSQGIH